MILSLHQIIDRGNARVLTINAEVNGAIIGAAWYDVTMNPW